MRSPSRVLLLLSSATALAAAPAFCAPQSKGKKPAGTAQPKPHQPAPSPAPADNRITLLGEVAKAGIYAYTPGFTVKQILEQAGGLTARADAANATLRRSGAAALSTIDCAKALAGDPIQNATLRPGDVLFIPAKPAPAEVKPEPPAATSPPPADKQEPNPPAKPETKPETQTPPERAPGATGEQSSPLTTNPPATGKASERTPEPQSQQPQQAASEPQIAFLGAVANPGRYYYEKVGLRQAFAAVGGPTKEADLDKIVVRHNMLTDPLNISEVKYDYQKVMKGQVPDIELSPGDVVQVPSRKPNRSFFHQVGQGIRRLLPPSGVQKQLGNAVGRIVSSERILRAVPVAGPLLAPAPGQPAASQSVPDGRAAAQLTPLESALIRAIQGESPDVRDRILLRAKNDLTTKK